MAQKQEQEDKKVKKSEEIKKALDELKPPLRLKSKRDLYMCLALHMESSPKCREPEGKFLKTGIVVCESDKVHKVMAMCCSTENLHAVEQVILNTPISLRNCCIYLSRGPCSTCAKFLIQREVSAVYYWPRRPEQKEASEEDSYEVDLLFQRSSTISCVFIPLRHLDSTTVSKLAVRTKQYKCLECKAYRGETMDEYYNYNRSSSECEEACKTKIQCALQYLNGLLNCSHGKFEGAEPAAVDQHTHALQLCYLLAARSDDPDKGVGCVLYDKNGFFFGAGYNGYPIGALYGNLPRSGRAIRGYIAKKPALVHAEANALLFRCKKNIDEDDILYCSKAPCSDCQKYIQCVGIKKIVATEKLEQGNSSVKMTFEYTQWYPVRDDPVVVSATQDGFSDQGANTSEEPKADVEAEAVSSSSRPEKRDTCLFLAIHMENSPYCEQPEGTVGPGSGDFKFCKTGIVICEGDKFQRIIAMDCSSRNLHAVQKALLRLPNELKGCNVYLSRKPCIDCVKFLVQAQVSCIFFWPHSEIEIDAAIDEFEKQGRLITSILKESCIYDAMLVPLVDTKTEKTGDTKISSIFDSPNLNQKIFEVFNVPCLKEKTQQQAYEEEINKAKKWFQMLTGNKAEKLLENTFHDHETHKCLEAEYYIQHALQLCNLLAARSDASDKVGTVVYKGEEIVAVGYNGFPRGIVNNFFENKDQDRIVCAEANTLILRPEDDLHGAELITSKEPCRDCRRLIKAKGLKRIIWPESESQPAVDATNNSSE